MKVINETVTFFSKKLQTPKFFLNLEKKRGNQNQIRKLIIDEKEIDGDVEILKKIESFYETLFKSQSFKYVSEIAKILCGITTPYLNNDQINLCEKTYLKLI